MIEPEYRDLRYDSRARTVCWLIERGRVTVGDGEDRITVKPGEWLFLNSTEGEQHFSPRSRVISIHFQLQWLTGEGVFKRTRNRVFSKDMNPELETAAWGIVRSIRTYRADNFLVVARNRIPLADNFAIEGAFHNWLAVYIRTMEALGVGMRQPDNYDDRVSAAIRMIDNHPMEEKFDVRGLCRACGLSTNQMGRLFKYQTGRSPKEYYDLRRLDLARHALAHTSIPIKEVAYQLGFGSPAHFSNWFVDHQRNSPRSYRKSRQGK